MNEVIIKRPVLDFSSHRLGKLLAVCCCLPVIALYEACGVDISRLPRLLYIILFVGSVFLLYWVIRKILELPKRIYLTISDDCIVVNDKRGQWSACFDEVKSFECEKVRLWRFTMHTGEIIVHFNDSSGYVTMIGADGLTMKPQALCSLLNERLSSYKQKKKS